ncbi:hypothetical protein [Nonomuraea pusilla]|uniref:hypothetical protein n=1 Tax=Nonomuraea pusilla TaxID=46177 RepID=UPI0006E4005C|nr:hypothetical protein [Nonomuraea pusilla]
MITSVGWMSQALGLFALMVYGTTAREPKAYAMAEMLDAQVLAQLANASAFTGIMLSALTRWGYFQYWWVMAKFVITLVQLYAGIFLLGPQLGALATGQQHASPAHLAGPALMASAIAFQGWLSIAKPWKRTPWAAAPARPPEPSAWFVGFLFAVPLLDLLLAARLGHPAPLFFALTAVTYPLWRRRLLRREARLRTS